MVGAYQRAREDPYLAADALLAYRGIERPTIKQRVGAAIEAEFMLRVSHFLESSKGG